MRPDLDEVFLSAYAELKRRTPAPGISVEFFPFAGLTHTVRYRENRLLIRVSDLLEDAPESVLQSLAVILLSRVYRRKADPFHLHRYRLFTMNGGVRQRAQDARRTRGRRRPPAVPQGQCYDLGACFDRLNAEYFGGSIDRPQLSWSLRRSRYTLGRYDSTRHAIFISRIFDAANVPQYVLDYVMYHEMLHVRHRTTLVNHRVLCHTREFRAEEQRYREYQRAKEWLRKCV